MVLFDASKDAWENEGVVDLVLEVTSTAAVDISSVCLGLFRQDFRSWVGKSKDDWSFVHGLDPFSFQCTSC